MGSVYRKQKAGRVLGWYIAYMDVDGKRRHLASHQPTKKEAQVLLAEIEGRVRRGQIGVPEPKPETRCTLDELFARWLDEYSSPKVKDLERRKRSARDCMNRLLPLLGKLTLAEVSRGRINKARDALLQSGLMPNTIRTTFQTLSMVLSWAIKEGLLTTNPVKGLELPRREISVEYLTLDEVARLLALAERRGAESLRHQSHRVALLLALYVGLRRGEIFGLRWQDIDIETGRLTIARSYRTTPKNGETRHLRLPPALAPVLTEWKKLCPKTSEQVVCPTLSSGKTRWGMSGEQGDHGLASLLEAAGCKPLRRGWHALRHTFASHFVMQGGNILTLARILGHADLKMTMVYAHLAPDFLSEEMARVRYR